MIALEEFRAAVKVILLAAIALGGTWALAMWALTGWRLVRSGKPGDARFVVLVLVGAAAFLALCRWAGLL